MAKIFLGSKIFSDTSAYGSGGTTQRLPGIIGWGTFSNAYGVIGTKGYNSNLESAPSSIANGENNLNPCLISFASSATTPGTVNSVGTYADYLRKLILAGGPAGTTELRIYSGVKPASTDVMTNLNDYSANLLITMPINGYSTDESLSGFRCVSHKPTTTRPNFYVGASTFEGMSFMLGVCNTFVNSTNISDAVATWFWYGNVYGGVADLSDVPFVIGTVGTTTASDLVIPDTLIKPNTAYKSYGFKFEIPVMYTI